MDLQLKPISREGIPEAISKAELYRNLNEPGEAESICRDILAADAENQTAFRLLGLSITDQFTGHASDRHREAESAFQSLTDPYERFYYAGILHERQAKAQLAAGKFEDAEDLLETALAVDPRNRWAFVDLARVAEKQHLFGKAIRMTNKALLIEPNDPDAIAVQGEIMAEMGAIPRAQANLQKLQSVCAPKGCPQVAQLSAAISRGPAVGSAKVPEAPKSN